MTKNTLIVTVESLGELQRRTADAFEQALAGDRPRLTPHVD